jgi:cytochrome c oxidase cbb3-type subunit 3
MSDDDKKSSEKFPGENNTGHIWDDNLRELLNDPPTWWRIGLHASWIFVLVYTLLYPSWPWIDTHFKGILGWTSIQEYKQSKQEIDDIRAPYENKITSKSASEILADDELSTYVVRSAKVLFGENCAACHGVGGQGISGFPVLADDDWLYGGGIADIETSIAAGRQGMMMAHDSMLSDTEVDKLANAVMARSVTEEPLYMEKGCIGCHGADGKGMSFMGSTNLTDGIYRFTATDQLASIKQIIRYGVNDPGHEKTRNAVMPAFAEINKLSESEIKKLAVYVHKLGGGQ